MEFILSSWTDSHTIGKMTNGYSAPNLDIPVQCSQNFNLVYLERQTMANSRITKPNLDF